MYRVYADGFLIHADNLEELRIYQPKLTLELNKTGSFEFVIYPDNIHYKDIAKVKTIITVYQDSELLFRGRVLNDEIGFYNDRQVFCEGELAFLLDTIQRPYDFTGSIEEYLTLLLANHNAQVEAEKQFTLGTVTVTDANDYIARSNIDHTNTLEELNKKLIDILGGFYQIRHENGVAILDYLQDFTKLSSQKVEFGENLLDLKKVRKGEEIATVLIPLGAKLKNEEGQDTDTRLTIASVNNGLDYIQDETAVSEYGKVWATVIFDDVTEASNLLTKGRQHLASLAGSIDTLELTAADLAKIDLSVNTFKIGTYVKVTSKPHGIDQLMLVSKLSISLFEPASNKLTLGGTIEGFSEAMGGVSSKQEQILGEVQKVAEIANNAVYNLERNLEASIEVAEGNITQAVTEKVYLKDETDKLVSEVSSKLEQTTEGFEMQFKQFNADIEGLAKGTDAEFEEIRKYIRFVDGSIQLGEVGNELELQISNDRISFLQGGAEVAYFSNNQFYVTDGHFTHSLQLGSFAFIPRDNGNLSFKKL